MPYRYGGFWKRSFAFLVDKMILLFICWFFCSSACPPWAPALTALNQKWSWNVSLLSIICWPISLECFIYLFSWHHRTDAGKDALRSAGDPILRRKDDSWHRLPPVGGLHFFRIDFLSGIPMDRLWREKQGWHDKIAGTVVIYRQEEFSGAETDQKMPWQTRTHLIITHAGFKDTSDIRLGR